MPAPQKVSILIVDDHLLLRQGLKQVLSHEFRDLAFGEAKTAEEALAQVKAQPWRLVIFDIGLPDKDGFFVLQEIRTLRPEAAVLMLSNATRIHCTPPVLCDSALWVVSQKVPSAPLC